jgi:lysophospholipase L1-like esterase
MKTTSLTVGILAIATILIFPAAAARAQTAAAPPAVHESKPLFKFAFGPGKVAPGYIQITPATLYTPERGYGFEKGAKITAVDRGGDNPLHAGYCTSSGPFLFSIKLPEGNYRVTVTLGDLNGTSTTTVKAELRRLLLEKVQTASGQFATRTFTVNTRTPKISTGGEVKLKDREKTTEFVDWDDKLTIEFNDARPCLCAMEITKADDAVTLFILGDSTVCDQPREPWSSWGQMLPRFFKSDVAVANHAESGESLRSSLGAKRLAKIMSIMKPGDYLFVQYGHNDMKEKGAGVGAFTTYKADLKRFVAETRQHGGTPVLVTPMNRKTLDASGKVTNSLGDYPEAVRQEAKEENVALIDLHAMSKQFYEALGKEKIDKAFQDGTHHNNYGSYELAKCIVAGIRQNNLGIAKYLADDVPPFDPSHPDPLESFHMPASGQSSTVAPLGN